MPAWTHLKGFPKAIEAVSPKTQVQLCLVHLLQHSLSYVSYKDRKEVAAYFKAVYTAATVSEAENRLGEFGEKWNAQYPVIGRRRFCSYDLRRAFSKAWFRERTNRKWIYYQSSRSQTFWKASADGTGEMQISAKKLLYPAVSLDGNLIAFLSQDKNKQSAIAVMTIEGEKVTKTLEFPEANLRPVGLIWSSDNRTLNYVARDESKNSLWSQSINEQHPRFVTDLGDKQIEQFDIAPGGSFACTRGEWLFDAILIDGLK